MTKRLPYFKWFASDLESDEWFNGLTDSDIGYYVRLMNHCWTNGSIPSDSAHRCRLFRIHHKTEQAAFKNLSRMFQEDLKDSSRMFHGPLQEQRKEYSRKSEKATESVNRRYERSTGENPGVDTYSDTDAESDKETPKPPPPDGGGKSPDGKPSPDNPSVVRPPAPPEEARKSEAVRAASAAVDAAAAEIHARHPKRRRDIGVKAVARALSTILRNYQHVSVLEAPRAVAEINRVHAAWCASEAWQKDGGEFAKGLENWLAPTKGRYESAPVVSIRPEIKPTVYFDDSYLTRVEEA